MILVRKIRSNGGSVEQTESSVRNLTTMEPSKILKDPKKPSNTRQFFVPVLAQSLNCPSKAEPQLVGCKPG